MKRYSNKKKYKEELILDNIALARSIAKRRNSVYYNEDTLGYAYYGLCKAADYYNPKKGYKFSTYAYRIINNCITEGLNRMRLDTGNLHIWRSAGLKDKQELSSQVTSGDFFKTIPVKDNIDDDIEAKQNRNLVLRYLKRLPDEERKVLELRYGLNDTWRVYTRNEISSKLGLSIATVERREKRGIQRLRSWMKIDGGIYVHA